MEQGQDNPTLIRKALADISPSAREAARKAYDLPAPVAMDNEVKAIQEAVSG